MRSLSQCIQHKNSRPVQFGSGFFGYKARVADIGEIIYPKTHGNIRLTNRGMVPPVLNWQWHYLDIATGRNMKRFRFVKKVPSERCNAVTAGMSRVFQVCEHSEDDGVGGRRSVNCYRRFYRCTRPLLESERSKEISDF
jgi:hypothetical protein